MNNPQSTTILIPLLNDHNQPLGNLTVEHIEGVLFDAHIGIFSIPLLALNSTLFACVKEQIEAAIKNNVNSLKENI